MVDKDYVKQILFGREYYYEKDNLNFNGNPLPSVSKSGIVTGKKKGTTKLTFKITFADKSVYTNSVNVLVI